MALRNFCLSLLFASSIGGCSSEDASSSAGNGSTHPNLDFTAFDAAVSQFLADHGLSGASAVIVHKDWGVVHLSGYGSFAPDRIYLVASSSKVLSVGILMRLFDQGLVDVDAPIGKYLSSWPPPPTTFDPPKSELEVAQLVSNSSGLVGLIDNPLYNLYLCQYIDSGTLTDCGKTIYSADDSQDRIPPDTQFHYGGGQWQLAGGIAEAVSGKAWADLVKETYVEPCGAFSMGYANQFTQAFTSGPDGGGGVGAALSYPSFFDADPSNLHPTQNPSIEGGAYTTAEDYGKVLLMHLRGGTCDGKRVLSDAAVSRMQVDRILSYGGMTTGSSPGGGGYAGYGLGWWIDRDHTGNFMDPGAYGAVPWLDLPRKYGGFLVIESDAGTGVELFTAVKPLADAVFDGAK